MSEKLITLSAALHDEIVALRNPVWRHPMDQLRLNGSPWAKFYSPMNYLDGGHDPVEIFIPTMGAYQNDEEIWVTYTGVSYDSQEYKEEVERIKGTFQ